MEEYSRDGKNSSETYYNSFSNNELVLELELNCYVQLMIK